MNKQEALERIEELQEYIESLEKEEESGVWVPREEASPWWYVDGDGEVGKFNWWDGNESDRGYLSMGNVFRTVKEAKMHKLRLQSMAQRGKMPEEGERIWYWSLGSGGPYEEEFEGYFIADYWLGSAKKTEEECQAWYEEFGKAWEVER